MPIYRNSTLVEDPSTPKSLSRSHSDLCSKLPDWPSLSSDMLGEAASFFVFMTLIPCFLLTSHDWLTSSVNPYPYSTSLGITLATATGLLALLGVRRMHSWQRVMMLASGAGIVSSLVLPPLRTALAVVAVLACSFALPPLIVGSVTNRVRQLCTALVVAGAVSLLCIESDGSRGPHALMAAGACGVSAVAAWVGQRNLRTPSSISFQGQVWPAIGITILLGAIAALWVSALRPLSVSYSSYSFWDGGGLGSASSSATTTAIFTQVLASEQGTSALVVLSLLLLAGLTSVAAVLIRRKGTPMDVGRVSLCASGIGTLTGLLLAIPFGAPFWTTASVPGTWGLTLALATLGLAAMPPCSQSAPRPAVLAVRNWQLRTKKLVTMMLVGASIVTVSTCHLVLRSRVSSFAQTTLTTQSPSFTPLPLVSQPMQDATIAMEDGHFYQHHGFDWIAMHRALRVDLREGRIEQGGSTLTQQLAKNLFLSNDRTLWRKLQEAAYTVELEHDLSKRRILEWYLNTIDYGMGQHGIKAAAAFYFHKSPEALTLEESALLVGLVPSPPQQELSFNQLSQGRQTALARVAYFFPSHYPQEALQTASNVPLAQVIYPFKDALDRGATEEIPARWHGVGFYFFADPTEPSSIEQVSPSLKPALATFLDEARTRYHLTGIDHLGVYNDRPMRQSQTALSAHAFGQAIDISGFRFTGGKDIQVADHVDPRVLAQLKPLEALLKKHFPIVVDWRDDPLRHQTHFHCEVRGPRTSSSFSLPVILADTDALTAASPNDASIETYPLKPLQRYELWQRGEIIRQTSPMSCGPASLATVLTYYLGRPTSTDEMVNLSGTKGRGSGPEDLQKACTAISYQAGDSTMTLAQMLRQIEVTNLPLIALWTQPPGHGHWVVVVGQQGGNLLVSNPNQGNVLMTKAEFCSKWGGTSGEALSILPPD